MGKAHPEDDTDVRKCSIGKKQSSPQEIKKHRFKVLAHKLDNGDDGANQADHEK